MFKLARIALIIGMAVWGSSILHSQKHASETRAQAVTPAQSQSGKAMLKGINSSEPMLLFVMGVCLIVCAKLLPRTPNFRPRSRIARRS